MDENPFPGLNIASSDFLNNLVGRSKCSMCNKSRKYYCYTCYIPVNEVKDKIPCVQLPIKIDVIKHPGETDGKSTAVHAAVLAPDHVKIYTYPDIPEYDKNKTVLVFPGPQSVSLEQIAKELTELSIGSTIKENKDNITKSEKTESEITLLGEGEPAAKCLKCDGNFTGQSCTKPQPPFDKVVFIDSTWAQCHKIFTDVRLLGMRQIEMKTYPTKFWRWQKGKPNTYLATIEAIYYFVCEFHQQFVSDKYGGDYDNLLFLFNFMYHRIRGFYDGGETLKAFGGDGQKGHHSMKKRNKKKTRRMERNN